MGIFFPLTFWAVSFFVGISAIVVGSIGFAVSRKKRKEKKNISRVMTAAFAVAFSIGIAGTLLSAAYMVHIVIINSIPPDDFIETEIVIEENGYQSEHFTANGVVYESLELSVMSENCISEAVFSYKTVGFMNGSQCGNYYRVENEAGLDLVCDSFGTIFTPREQLAAANEYYSNIENLCGYYDDWDGNKRALSEKENHTFFAFIDLDHSALQSITVNADELDEFEIKLVSKDFCIYVKGYWFVAFDGELYYVRRILVDERDKQYVLLKLPQDIGESLININGD